MYFHFWDILLGIGVLFSFLFFSKKKTQKEQAERKRVASIDFMKGLAILLIVIIHASDLTGFGFINDHIWFAIPLFLFISGLLLASRYDTVDKRYYLNIVTRIIVPYALIILFINFGNGKGLLNLLEQIFLGTANGNYYFIPMIIQLYLLFPLLLKLKKYLSEWYVQAGVFLISYFFFYYDFIWQTPEWNSNPYSLAFCGRFLIFFTLGMFYGWHNQQRLLYGLILYFSAVFFMSAGISSLYVMYIAALPAFFILKWLSELVIKTGFFGKVCHKIMGELGKHTLIIYLIHTYIIHNYLLWMISGMDNLAGFFFLIIAGTFLSYLVSYSYGVIRFNLLKGFKLWSRRG